MPSKRTDEPASRLLPKVVRALRSYVEKHVGATHTIIENDANFETDDPSVTRIGCVTLAHSRRFH